MLPQPVAGGLELLQFLAESRKGWTPTFPLLKNFKPTLSAPVLLERAVSLPELIHSHSV